MPPPTKPPLPKAAEPKYSRTFDPWNSVALGHQRAETRGPNGWRENRTRKLQSQLGAGNTGGARLIDTVGAGADEEEQAARNGSKGKTSVVEMLRKPGTMGAGKGGSAEGSKQYGKAEEEGEDEQQQDTTNDTTGKLFAGLVIYVNGSTHPLISDHKLKKILVEYGARLSIHLGRRQVTHVIVGKPSGPSGGAGGGLASGKLEKEIRRVGGCGVKYVGAEW